jgi:hypothetical protein
MLHRPALLSLAAFVSTLLASFPATAQTLNSITINNSANSLRPQFQNILSTGSTVLLTATGTYSDGSTQQLNVTWVSADQTTISVDTYSGLADGVKAGGPITIHAVYPGFSPDASIQLTVVPQTTLYAVTAKGLNYYDASLLQAPTTISVVSHPYDTTGRTFSAPVTMSEDGTLLYVAQFAPDATTDSSFEIAIYDLSCPNAIQPGRSPCTRINVLNTTISSGLCYPSGLAVKNGQLYVVNAGPNAHVNPSTQAAPCASAPGPNVQVYDEYNFSLLQTLEPLADFGDATAGPVGVATSVDPKDPYVYIADPHFKGTGTVHIIDSTTATSNTVVQHVTVGSLPAGITVGTSYPSTAPSPQGTVYVVGPGTGGESIQALSCVPSSSTPPLVCTVYSQRNINNFSNSFFWPVSMVASSDGNYVYLADPSVSSAVIEFAVANPNEIASTNYNCAPSQTCSTAYAVTVNAGGQYVFGGVVDPTTGFGDIVQLTSPQLNVASSTAVVDYFTAAGEDVYALAITRNPEAKFTITSQVGFQINGTLTLNGNFYDVQAGTSANQYRYSWNDPVNVGGGGGNITVAMGSTQPISVSHTYTQAGGVAFSTTLISSDALPQLSSTTQGIIASVPVGPVQVTLILAPVTLTFAQQRVGTTSSPQTVQLTNTGTAQLTTSDISITGVNVGDFAQTNTCGSLLVAGASCQISVTFAPAGTGSRSATLVVSDNATGSPQMVTLVGSGPDFSIEPPASSTATVTPGQTATYTVSLVPVAGFSQNLTLTCSGAPAKATCNIAPASVSLSGTTAATATVTVTTTAAAAMLPVGGTDSLRKINGGPVLVLACVLTLFIMASFYRSRVDHRFGWAPAMILISLLVVSMTLVSCGGGSSPGSGSPAAPTGTTGTASGTYTIAVTATSGTGASALSHDTKLTLIVQ